MSNILNVFDDRPDELIFDDVFIINEKIKISSDARREEILATCTKIVNERQDSFLLAPLLPYIVFGRYASLPKLIIFHEILEKRLDDNGYEIIKYHGSNDGYKSVIKDISQENNIKIKGQNNSTQEVGVRSFISIDILLHFVDQIFSLILALLLYRNWKTHEMVMFSMSNDSLSVANKLKQDTVIVDTSKTVGYFLRNKTYSTNKNVDIRPINTYSSLFTILEQIKVLYWLIYQSRSKQWDVEHPLNNGIQEEFGIHITNTVHYASCIAIKNSIQYILTYPIFKTVIDTENPKSILVRTDNPYGRLQLAAATEKGVNRFYLPHSIICGSEILPSQKDTIQFVEGEYAIKYLKQSPLCNHLPNLVVTGLPKHEQIMKQYRPIHDPLDCDQLSVLVATQPFDDVIRKQFVYNILKTVDNLYQEYTIIIKPHPVENSNFYVKLFKNHSLRDHIKIESGAIEPHIQNTDLTVTINSNVGLESGMLKSCAISYNEWVPHLSVFPFIKQGPIPLAQSQSELHDIFDSIDRKEHNKMVLSQYQFVQDNFVYDNCVENIAGVIDANTNNSPQ